MPAAERGRNSRTIVPSPARLSIVTDPPDTPFAPEPRLKKAVLTLVIFGVLGLLLSLASVIVAATLDRTIRVPGDISLLDGKVQHTGMVQPSMDAQQSYNYFVSAQTEAIAMATATVSAVARRNVSILKLLPGGRPTAANKEPPRSPLPAIVA